MPPPTSSYGTLGVRGQKLSLGSPRLERSPMGPVLTTAAHLGDWVRMLTPGRITVKQLKAHPRLQ